MLNTEDLGWLIVQIVGLLEASLLNKSALNIQNAFIKSASQST